MSKVIGLVVDNEVKASKNDKNDKNEKADSENRKSKAEN